MCGCKFKFQASLITWFRVPGSRISVSIAGPLMLFFGLARAHVLDGAQNVLKEI